MALEPAVRQAVQRIVQAFRDYATQQGWDRGDYRMWVRVNADWGRIHIILAAKAVLGGPTHDRWRSAKDHLVATFQDDDPDLARSVSLTLFTLDEIEQGGPHALSPQFVDADELLAGGPIESSLWPASPLNIGESR